MIPDDAVQPLSTGLDYIRAYRLEETSRFVREQRRWRYLGRDLKP